MSNAARPAFVALGHGPGVRVTVYGGGPDRLAALATVPAAHIGTGRRVRAFDLAAPRFGPDVAAWLEAGGMGPGEAAARVRELAGVLGREMRRGGGRGERR